MKTVYEYGSPASSSVLIQMVDDHDLDVIDNEVSFCLHGMHPLFSAARRSVTVLKPRCLKCWN